MWPLRVCGLSAASFTLEKSLVTFSMANASTEDAALHDNMRLLRMLATDPVAQQGLRLVMQAGRRHGLDTAMFAGVTMSSSHSPAAEKAQGQPKVGSTGNERPRAPATGSPASASRPRRRKSAAKQKRDAEKYAAKRMTKKFLAVMPLVRKFLHEQQQQQQQQQLLSVDVEELPQFREPPAGTPGTSQAMQVAQAKPLQRESECRRLDCNAQRVDSPATATMAGCKHGISSPSHPTGRDGSPAEQPPKRFSELQPRVGPHWIGDCSGRDQPG